MTQTIPSSYTKVYTIKYQSSHMLLSYQTIRLLARVGILEDISFWRLKAVGSAVHVRWTRAGHVSGCVDRSMQKIHHEAGWSGSLSCCQQKGRWILVSHVAIVLQRIVLDKLNGPLPDHEQISRFITRLDDCDCYVHIYSEDPFSCCCPD